MLHYAVGHLTAPEYSTTFPAKHDINFGAVFAHHLVGLQRKLFTDKKKKKMIGSLLTPIFQYCGINLDSAHVTSKKDLLGEAYLKHTGMITGNWMYVFTDFTGTHHIQLPRSNITSLSTLAALRFQPDHALLSDAPSSRKRRRSTSSTVRPTTPLLCASLLRDQCLGNQMIYVMIWLFGSIWLRVYTRFGALLLLYSVVAAISRTPWKPPLSPPQDVPPSATTAAASQEDDEED